MARAWPLFFELDRAPSVTDGREKLVARIGRGKAVDRGDKCTIYKRNVEVEKALKMQTSRKLLTQINKRFPTFPFTMRNFEGNREKLGITELKRTDLVQPYPVLSEKEGDYVAQFKFTAIITPKGTLQITGLPLDMKMVNPSKPIEWDQGIQTLVNKPFQGKLPGFYDAVQFGDFNVEVPRDNNMMGGQQRGGGGGGRGRGRGRGKRKQVLRSLFSASFRLNLRFCVI